MAELMKYLPLVNLAVLIITAVIAVIRLSDAVKNIKEISNRLQEAVNRLDRRLTVVETVCRLNHAAAHRELLNSED